MNCFSLLLTSLVMACLILPMIYQLFSGQPISFLDFDDVEITRHAHRALNIYIWAYASLKSS